VGFPYRSPIVAVDLDGVLATTAPWSGPTIIPPPYDGASDFTRKLRRWAWVIIHTARITDKPASVGVPATHDEIELAIRQWAARYHIELDEVWRGPGKPFADVYIDDRAVACAPGAGLSLDAAYAEARRLSGLGA
jgi:hypothetical protein